MKKRLKGLLSIWLAAVMLLGMLPVLSTPAMASPSNRIYIYTGTEPLKANDELYPYVREGVSEGTQLSSLVPLGDGVTLTGWNLWKFDNINSGYVITDKLLTKDTDWTLSADDVEKYATGDYYVFEPIYSGKIAIYTGTDEVAVDKFVGDYQVVSATTGVPVSEQASVIDVIDSSKTLEGWDIWSAGWSGYHSGTVWNERISEESADYTLSSKYFVTSDDPQYYLVPVYGAAPPHKHPICGAEHTDIGDHTGTCENVDWTAWDGTTAFPGGNVYLSADVTLKKTLKISSGTVNLCLNGKVLRISESASAGAVIEVSKGAELNLCDCQTTEHKFSPDGSGLWVLDEDGTKIVSGGVITGGNTTVGSAICSDGTLRIYGGNIVGNHGSSRAVVHSTGAEFSMYGGSICGNTGDEGNDGVGLCLWNSTGKHQIRGGKIYENTAEADDSPGGVGVYVSLGSLTISGAVEIYDNKRCTENDNIYVAWNRSSLNEYSLIIDGELTNATPIGVWARYEDIIIKADGTNVTDLTEYMDNFTPDNTGRVLQLSVDKKNIKLLSPHSHAICGAETCTADHNLDGTAENHQSVTWTAWDGTDMDESEAGIQLTAGSYYLNTDVVLTATANITGELNLCLNGHSITKNTTGTVITVENGATLNICDCKGSGSISATVTNADITGIDNSGNVNIYGGTVKAAKSGNQGTCIGIRNSGSVTVSGGEINSTGHGISNFNNGTLTVSGGTVKGTSTGISTNSDITISGSPNITGGCDIMLYGNSKIIFGGALGALTDTISVKMKNPGTFTSGWTTKMGDAANYSSYFTSADSSYTVQKENGELKLGKKTYEVSVSANPTEGGTVSGSGTYVEGTSVTVTATPATGYKFVNWTENGSEVSDNASYTFTASGNRSLVANFTKLTYTVTYTDNVDGEEIFANVVKSASHGEFAPEFGSYDPARTGYNFDGWYKEQACENAWNFATDTVTDNITLYAKWTVKESVSISEDVQTYTWDGVAKSFEIEDTTLSDFTVEYYVSDVWMTIAPSAVGTYDVKVTRAEDDTYKAYEKTITGGLVINAATPDAVPPAANTLTYNGIAQELITAGSATGGTMQYALGENENAEPTTGWNTTIPTASDAGTYYVWYKVVGDSSHNDTDPQCISVTIDKAEVEIPEIADKVFTGETLKADINETDYYSVKNDGGINVGEYDVVLTLKDSQNYKWEKGDSEPLTLKFNITAAAIEDVTHPTPGDDLFFTNEPQELITAGSSDDGTMQYALGENENDAPTTGWSTTIPTASDAGTYYVWYKVDGGDNYNDSDPVCITVTIAPGYYATVTGGSGDGWYPEGALVEIEAEDIDDYNFDKWEVVSGEIVFDDETAAETSFVMPDTDVEVKAVQHKDLTEEFITLVLIADMLEEDKPVKMPEKPDTFGEAVDTYSIYMADRGFTDVTRSDWFYGDVTALANKGVVGGYPDGSFMPYGEVTWGEALKMVMKAVGYGDIAPTGDHWASGYLETALADLLISGEVELDAVVAREDVANLTAQALKLAPAGIEYPFDDYAPEAAVALYAAGIIKGSADDGQLLFRAESTITRAEMSAIVWRVYCAR